MSLNDLKIVFIYLGKVIPEYVLENASRTADLFGFQTHLFIESTDFLPRNISISQNLNIACIKRRDFTEEYNLDHDLDFRDGFWVKTFERLLTLKDIHKTFGDTVHLLHVESDVLLMPTFPFIEVLNEKIMWQMHNSFEDVASLVYLPSLNQSSWLYDKLLEEAKLDSKITDMSALSRIRSKYPDYIEVFPDVASESGEFSEPNIFDGLSFGMWFCGLDPRNTYGLHVLHENGDFKANDNKNLKDILSNFSILLEDGELLYLQKQQQKFLIHSIHVHSKDRELFKTTNSWALDKYVEHSVDRDVIVLDFNRKMLLGLLRDNFLRGTFFSYIKHFMRFLLKKPSNGKPVVLAYIHFLLRKYKK
jgi:hypothetical protein